MKKKKDTGLDFEIDKLTNSIENLATGDVFHTEIVRLTKVELKGIIKEPLDVDFVVDPRPLTEEEEKAISNFIRADKEKRKLKELQAKSTTKVKSKQHT